MKTYARTVVSHLADKYEGASKKRTVDRIFYVFPSATAAANFTKELNAELGTSIKPNNEYALVKATDLAAVGHQVNFGGWA